MLILGGTAEARALVALLAQDPRFEPVSSLAGRTTAPLMPQGRVRVGGFGGVDGLAAYVRTEGIALIADATHPFAARISAHAHAAAARCDIAYLRLERPAWSREPGDDWRNVNGAAEAALALEPGARALVTIGRQVLAPFAARANVEVLARMIEAPETPLPPHMHILIARPPFTLEGERALIAEHRISVLVTKNSGGSQTRAKLDAAREAGLPVIMIARPAKPDAPTAESAGAMRDLVAATLFA
jgi:precorrin-6A/cobalt-precorrin-6A reductase